MVAVGVGVVVGLVVGLLVGDAAVDGGVVTTGGITAVAGGVDAVTGGVAVVTGTLAVGMAGVVAAGATGTVADAVGLGSSVGRGLMVLAGVRSGAVGSATVGDAVRAGRPSPSPHEVKPRATPGRGREHRPSSSRRAALDCSRSFRHHRRSLPARITSPPGQPPPSDSGLYASSTLFGRNAGARPRSGTRPTPPTSFIASALDSP